MNNETLVKDLMLEMTPEKDPFEELEEKSPKFFGKDFHLYCIFSTKNTNILIFLQRIERTK
jgi:hypothetical protein